MNEDCATIIDNLIKQRHSKGITQNELAKATNLTDLLPLFRSCDWFPYL